MQGKYYSLTKDMWMQLGDKVYYFSITNSSDHLVRKISLMCHEMISGEKTLQHEEIFTA